MAESRKIVVLIAASLSAAIAGCMAATDEGDGREDPSAALAPADVEESVGEAPAAQHCHGCPPGTTYVAVVNTCVTEPARFDATPGAYGCRYGAILTGRGNVICLPGSEWGPVPPPVVAIAGGLPGPQPGDWPPPGGGLPGPQLGDWPPPGGGLPGPQLGDWPPPGGGLPGPQLGDWPPPSGGLGVPVPQDPLAPFP
ncbi:hypothetical protein [Sorangium sp. So ce385]|uniref:hypothetical protein n=1 Tax=Sorangium sp. So ce385 TaxID=3133308 RepID=UPI003F5AEF9A